MYFGHSNIYLLYLIQKMFENDAVLRTKILPYSNLKIKLLKFILFAGILEDIFLTKCRVAEICFSETFFS